MTVYKNLLFYSQKNYPIQSDQIGRLFQQLGYFCRLSKEMAPKWQYHLLHFHLNKLFKYGLYFRIIWIGNCFGHFSKNWVIFTMFLVTLTHLLARTFNFADLPQEDTLCRVPSLLSPDERGVSFCRVVARTCLSWPKVGRSLGS